MRLDAAGKLRRGAGVAIVGLLLATAPGCGSDETAPGDLGPRDPAEWVASYCDHVGAYLAAAEESILELDRLGAAMAGDDLSAHRDNLVGYYRRWSDANDALFEDLTAAGYPDMAGGESAARAVLAAVRGAGPAARLAMAAIADLPLDDPDAFWTGLRTIEGDFAAASRIEPLTYPSELDALFDAVPGCGDLP